MTLATIAAVPVILLDAFVSARYCMKLIRGTIAPRLATWLIFELGVLLSLGAYLASRDHSLEKAALNATDAVLVTVICTLVSIRQARQPFRFTKNERYCLMVGCVAAAVWLFTRTGWSGLIGFQVVMSVAYLPTLESVWRWKPGPPPEPLDKWSVNVIIAVLGLVPPLLGHQDYLAMIYPLRALILCLCVVALIVRWERKSKDESQMLL